MRLLFLDRVAMTLKPFVHSRNLKVAQTNSWKAVPDWFAFATSGPQGANAARGAWRFFVSASQHGVLDPQPAKEAIERYRKMEGHDPWLAEMLQGYYLAKLGWSRRGHAFAGKVTDKQWQGFNEAMTRVAGHYRAAYQMHPDRPEAASQMIGIAMSGHDDDSPWVWFQRCIDAEIDHPAAYEKIVLAMRPRWGGSHEAMLNFGEQCVRTGRFDTTIPYAYVQVVLGIMADERDVQALFAQPKFYGKLAHVLSRTADRPSLASPHGLNRWQSEYLTLQLGFAMLVERHAESVKLWERLGERANPAWLGFFNLRKKYDESRCHAYLEQGEALKRARLLTSPPREDPQRSRKMLETFQQLLANSRVPEARFYLECWVERAQMEVDYHDGKWVKLNFDPEFRHWMGGDIRQWICDGDSSATGSNREMGENVYLYHQCHFPGPREMSARVQVLKFDSENLITGLFLGHCSRGENGRLFFLEPRSRMVGIEAYEKQCVAGPVPALPSRLHVKAWGPEHFEFFIDGAQWRGGEADPQFDLRSNQVGIGTPWWAYNVVGEVRFSEVRVRKLSYPPPPKFEQSKQRVEYYTQAIERNPGLHEHRADRALAHYYENQYAECIADLQAYYRHKPSDPKYLLFLGDAYAQTGKYGEAIQQLEQAASKAPPAIRHTPQRMLAYYLATAPEESLRDNARALKLAKALAEAPQGQNSSVLTTLACAQAETGDFAAALESLQAAEKLNPEESLAELIPKYRQSFEQKKPWRHAPAE